MHDIKPTPFITNGLMHDIAAYVIELLIGKVMVEQYHIALNYSPGVVYALLHVCCCLLGQQGQVNLYSVCVLQCDGSLLATGSYDGFARIWSTDGML